MKRLAILLTSFILTFTLCTVPVYAADDYDPAKSSDQLGSASPAATETYDTQARDENSTEASQSESLRETEKTEQTEETESTESTTVSTTSSSSSTSSADPTKPSTEPTQPTEPTRITGMSAKSVAVKKIKLSWKCNKSGKMFTVYRATSKNGKFRKVGTTKNHTYTNKVAKSIKRYYYYVKTGSVTSKKVSAVAFYATTAKVKRSGEGTKITWAKHPYANGYKVYRSYSKDGKWKCIKTAKKSSRSYKDIAPSGKRCYYKVKAIYKKGKNITYSRSSDIRKAKKIYRVFIETGHGIDAVGRWDPGACWNGYQEAKLMIPIAKAMTTYLRDQGVYVYTDAFSGNNINLFKSVRRAKKKKLSAMVHLHCDAYFEPSGTLPLYKTARQKKLAKALNEGVHATIKIPDRGLCYRKDLYALRKNCGTVACIFETGCIKKDNKLLRNKADAYGKGLAKGMCRYLGIEFDQ